MPPIDTSALAGIFAWVWSQYGKQITDKALKAAWERLRWEDRALAYGQKVQRLYGTMQILGQAQPVPLEGIYTAISMLDKPTAWQRYTLDEMQADFTGRGYRYFRGGEEKNRRDGLELVRQGANLFILGKPGAGKTTFLKHVALWGVSGYLDRVPVFVGLKQLADSGLSVFDYVVQEFKVCDFPDAKKYLEQMLKSGRAILLFDGLDEVSVADDLRPKLIRDVEMFTWQYNKCQCLITCREAASTFTFRGYTYVEIADFTQDEIRSFARTWFGAGREPTDRAELFLSELEKPDSEGLQELSRVPLLLALICLAFDQNLKVSQRRVELYEEALEALLTKWDSSRNIRRDEVFRELTLKRKEQMLAQVAAQTFRRREYFISRKALARAFEEFLTGDPNTPAAVDGDVVLRALVAQHGLFLEQARDIYSFAHLTFQEYFTARYVVENQAQGTLPWLVEQYADPRYREVFSLVASQLPDATEFCKLLLARLVEDAIRQLAVATLLRQAAHEAVTLGQDNTVQAIKRGVYVYIALNLTAVEDRDLVQRLDLKRNHALDAAREHYHRLNDALDEARKIADEIARADLYGVNELLAHLQHVIHKANSLAVDRENALHDAEGLAQELSRINAREQTREVALNLIRNLDTSRTLRGILDDDNRLGLLARDVARVEGRPYISDAFADNMQQATSLRVLAAFLEAVVARRAQLDELDTLEELARLVKQLAEQRSSIDTVTEVNLTRRSAAVMKQSGLVFPKLGQADWDVLASSLRGNQLLLECLGQSVVADRGAIEERLLLVPEA